VKYFLSRLGLKSGPLIAARQGRDTSVGLVCDWSCHKLAKLCDYSARFYRRVQASHAAPASRNRLAAARTMPP